MLAGGTGITPLWQVAYAACMQECNATPTAMRHYQDTATSVQHPVFPGVSKHDLDWCDNNVFCPRVLMLHPTPYRAGVLVRKSWCDVVQVLHAVLKDREDRTEVSLIYANNTSDDILLRTQLDELASEHDNFKVWYTGAMLPLRARAPLPPSPPPPPPPQSVHQSNRPRCFVFLYASMSMAMEFKRKSAEPGPI